MRFRLCPMLLLVMLIFSVIFPAAAQAAEGFSEDGAEVYSPASPEIGAPSGLLMEQSTGEILYEKNADEQLPIASVTKVMTLLLIMEALDSGRITLSDEIACSEKVSKMEGSKVFLSVNERVSVEELIKSIVIASGNDAAVAAAELLSGSEESFVALMNERAAELGLKNTQFMNCTGLDAEGHYSSARDVAVMSRALLNHEQIYDYTTIWMDSLRDGKFILNNTNKLIRYYDGATGLKTGSTSVSKYCLSASARRDGMDLIAVVLRADSSDKRFADARSLLDFGFANYGVKRLSTGEEALPDIPVIRGKEGAVSAVPLEREFSCVTPKGMEEEVTREISLAEDLKAPVDSGQTVGMISYYLDGELLSEIKIVAAEEVLCMEFSDVFLRLLSELLMVSGV